MLVERLRAIKFHLIFWQVLREFLLPVALGKAQIGDGVTVLGTDIFLREGVIMPSAEKLPLYDEWLERASSLSVIERAELKALNGTLNFGSFAIPEAQLHLRCSYRAAVAKFSWALIDGRRDVIPVSPLLQERFRWLRSAFQLTPRVLLRVQHPAPPQRLLPVA